MINYRPNVASTLQVCRVVVRTASSMGVCCVPLSTRIQITGIVPVLQNTVPQFRLFRGCLGIEEGWECAFSILSSSFQCLFCCSLP